MDQLKQCRIAFFDSEFTSDSAKERGIQELIQCAMIVCEVAADGNNKIISINTKPIFEYKTFVKTNYNKTLSDYIKQLTGIQQDDVDKAKPFKKVMENLKQITEDYEIKAIYVWGPDNYLLRQNCNLNGCKKEYSKFINKIHDISLFVSRSYGEKTSISQDKMCQKLHIKSVGQKHDAYYDALNLCRIIKKVIKERSFKIFK